jgi:malate synthase
MLRRCYFALLATPKGVEITGKVTPDMESVLSKDALEFVADLHRRFEPERQACLKRRVDWQHELDGGKKLGFLPETKEIREGDWKCAPVPKSIQNRTVEITGPTDRKMIINALNSGAKVFMADFEDSTSPTWHNIVDGQVNVRDAFRGGMTFTSPEGKEYKMKKNVATMMVRARGWHLDERHMIVDGKPVSGSIFDFGMTFFHSGKHLVDSNRVPCFYLPKMQHYKEARLWNSIFTQAQKDLGIPHGSIRATCLIETIFAAFQMHEILYELKDHSIGLNCGRWDYIFSMIKAHREHPDMVFPDRASVTMQSPFMRAYTLLTIQTCHKRGVFAMGGMAAQIPIKGDDKANDAMLAKLAAGKEQEAKDGHDGTWVAHPGLVQIAADAFAKHMKAPNQIDKQLPDYKVSVEDMLKVPKGTVTEEGLRWNVRVGVDYLEAWLRGHGCVPLYNLMEDAATAEISRTQVWQWIRHESKLDTGKTVTRELFEKTIMPEEMARLKKEIGEEKFKAGKFELARDLFVQMSLAKECPDFLTLEAYKHI